MLIDIKVSKIHNMPIELVAFCLFLK